MEKEINAVVLIADGTKDADGIVIKAKHLKVPAIVPVSLNFDKKIGFANLRVEGEQVFADVKINEESLNNLSDKELDVLYPVVDAVRDGYHKVGICSVGFCESPNVDDRIKTIGEQKDDAV